MATQRTRRRIAGLLIGLPLGYLVAANLFLSTPLGVSVVNRKPEKAHVTWRRATSFWPGSVTVHGLEIRGQTRKIAWSVAIDRAEGRIALLPLLARRFEASEVHARGARVSVDRHGLETPERKPTTARKSWTIAIEGVQVEELRDVVILETSIDGQGSASGAFRIVTSTASTPLTFELRPSKAIFSGAVVKHGNELLASRVQLSAEASMEPFAPRDSPGFAAFDHLTGSLDVEARIGGDVMEQAGGALGVELGRGRVSGGLFIEDGKLGSRSDVAVETGGATFTLAVVPAGIELRANGQNVSLGPGPLLTCDRLEALIESSETSISRLLAAAKDATAPAQLAGTFVVDRPSLAFGRRVPMTLGARHAEGRMDLRALLDRRIAIHGLRADGVTWGVDLLPPTQEPPSPYDVDVGDAQIELQEARIGDACIEGPALVAGSLSLEEGKRIAIPGIVVVMPDGRLWFRGASATPEATVAIEASTAGSVPFAELPQALTGHAVVRTRVESLAFLEPLFQRTPWLRIDGAGELDLDATLSSGTFVAGSRMDVNAAALEARILDSLATGRGVVRATVTDRLRLVTAFTDVAFRNAKDPEAPPYVTSKQLSIVASSREALHPGRVVTDLAASLDLKAAEIPDLRAYSGLLPEAAGVALVSGRGTGSLELEIDGNRSGRGFATLASDSVRVMARELEIEGALRVEVPIRVKDIEARTLDIDGTVLTLDPVAYRSTEDDDPPRTWSGRLLLERASAVWARPMGLRSEVRVEMADVGPLLAIFAPTKSYLAWLARTLKVGQITAHAGLEVEGEDLHVRSLDARGGKLQVQARLHLAKDRKDGDMLITYDDLSAGLELRGGQRDWKILRPEGWYEESRLPD